MCPLCSYGDRDIAPFDETNPFNIILNIAVGGDWPCNVGASCGDSRADPVAGSSLNDVPKDMLIHSVTFDPYP